MGSAGLLMPEIPFVAPASRLHVVVFAEYISNVALFF